MAEGDERVNEGHVTIAGGSEFVFDFYCEVCRDDDKHFEAAGFCVDCGEYLCETCVNSHKRARPSRYHKILDGTEMPKDTPLSLDRAVKTISTRCKAHPGEAVKFYCNVHCEFGCTTCFATVHKVCDGVESVLEQSEILQDSQEFTSFIQNLNSINQNLKVIDNQTRIYISETEQFCLDAISSIKGFRISINTIIDKVEQYLITQTQNIASEHTTMLQSLKQEVHSISQRTNMMSSEIDELKASNRVCQLYINMKMNQQEMKELRYRINLADERNYAKALTFGRNNELCRLQETIDTFGTLTVRDMACKGTSRDGGLSEIHVDAERSLDSGFPRKVMGHGSSCRSSEAMDQRQSSHASSASSQLMRDNSSKAISQGHSSRSRKATEYRSSSHISETMYPGSSSQSSEVSSKLIRSDSNTMDHGPSSQSSETIGQGFSCRSREVTSHQSSSRSRSAMDHGFGSWSREAEPRSHSRGPTDYRSGSYSSQANDQMVRSKSRDAIGYGSNSHSSEAIDQGFSQRSSEMMGHGPSNYSRDAMGHEPSYSSGDEMGHGSSNN